jgi:hypothetical protein
MTTDFDSYLKINNFSGLPCKHNKKAKRRNYEVVKQGYSYGTIDVRKCTICKHYWLHWWNDGKQSDMGA